VDPQNKAKPRSQVPTRVCGNLESLIRFRASSSLFLISSVRSLQWRSFRFPKWLARRCSLRPGLYERLCSMMPSLLCCCLVCLCGSRTCISGVESVDCVEMEPMGIFVNLLVSGCAYFSCVCVHACFKCVGAL
jgi:hypothetical protein